MGSVLSAEDQLLGPSLATRRGSGVRGLLPPHWVGLFMEKIECHGSFSLPWLGVASGVLGWVSLRGDVLLGGR